MVTCIQQQFPPLVCAAGVTLCCFLYLQNTIRFVSENTENVFAVLLSVKWKFKWFNKLQFLVYIRFLIIFLATATLPKKINL